MTRPIPVAFRWIDVDVMDANGVVETRPAMVPLQRFRKLCDRQYGDPGGVFILSPDEHASERSRRHYFACLNEAWKNLPENIQHRYPTMEHLRKTALIKAGFRKERAHACPNYRDALELAAMFKDVDEFSMSVIHRGPTDDDPATLFVYTAESQKTFAMKADRFQASKVAVLGLVAGLIGVTREELERHAKPEEVERPDETRNPDPSLGEPHREAAGEGARRPSLPAPGSGAAVPASRSVGARPNNGRRG